MGPLAGVRVVECTTVLLGPYCSQIMGDMGADVIKVETPHGDPVRYLGAARHPGMSGMFLNANRNKRSMVLNLKEPAGLDAFNRLVGTADVFLHNMRRQAIQELAIDYPTLSHINPQLVYCHAYGFGRQGPYRDFPAYDDVIQGASGMAMLQARLSGTPQYVASDVADKVTALMVLAGILMALFHRERTGEGQEVEVPMFETMVSFNLLENLYGAAFDPPVSDPVYPRVVARDRRPYRTADGYISAIIYNDKQWERFFAVTGRQDLKEDARFNSFAERMCHIDVVYGMVANLFQERTTAEWLKLLSKAEIPAMPLLDTADLLTDPHLRAAQLFVERDHPSEGTVRVVDTPIRMSRTPSAIQRGAPRLGEHSVELLRELGYAEEEIGHLLDVGAIAASDAGSSGGGSGQ